MSMPASVVEVGSPVLADIYGLSRIAEMRCGEAAPGAPQVEGTRATTSQ